jgi:hypothetical protein
MAGVKINKLISAEGYIPVEREYLYDDDGIAGTKITRLVPER